MKKGTVTFKDNEGNFSTMRFVGEASKTKTDVETLAAALTAKSDCDVRADAIVEKTYAGVDGGGNRDLKGVITVSDSDGETHKWSLPGYNGTSAIDKEGQHMIDPDLQTLVDAIQTFTGETYTVLRSPVIQTR